MHINSLKFALLSLSLLGCLTSTAICEEGWEVSYLKEIQGLIYSPTESTPYTGDVFELSDEGVVTMRGRYYRGLQDDQWEYYDNEGKIKKAVIYQTGQLRMSCEYDGTDKSGRPIKHGLHIEYHENGEVREKSTFCNNELHGEYLECYENGQPYRAGYYENGNRVGTWTEWYANGMKMLIETYTNHRLHGVYKLFHSNGMLNAEGQYKYGKEDGVWTAWDWGGRKKSSGEFRDGVLWGQILTYHRNGEVESKGVAVNGEPEGLFKEYYNDGQIFAEVYFKSGKEHGLATEWYRDGKKKKTGEFYQGEPHGTWSFWDSTNSGALSEKIVYAKGELRSKSTYHENGRLKSQTEYSNEKKNGKYTLYYDNGQLNERGKYKDDVMHGQWTCWYENGRKKKEYADITGIGIVTTYYSNGNKESEGVEDNTGLRMALYGYRAGPDIGKWTYWYENGQKKREENLGDSPNEIRFVRVWYPDGSKKQDYTLEGDSNEVVYTWYENGQLESKQIGGFLGYPSASFESWYSNGWKKSKGQFIRTWLAPWVFENLREGEWTFWSLNGAKQIVYFKAIENGDDRFNSQTGVFIEKDISEEIIERGRLVISTKYPRDYVKDGRWIEVNSNGIKSVIVYNEGIVVK